jgi:membrane-associated phospholipid phosphatase
VPSPVRVFGPAPPALAPDRARRRADRSGVGAGLATAVVSGLGVVLIWRIFVAGAPGQRVDQAVFDGARYGRSRLWDLAQPVLDGISVPYVALVLVGAVLIAALRRRWGLAVQVALLMGGANLTTQLLKAGVLSRPDLGATALFPNSLPSGHTTVAASVSAALVFVVPPRVRPWAAVLGAVYTAIVGVSVIVGGWHRPSDAAAAVLVVLAWSGLACAVAAATRPRAADGSVAAATAELARPAPEAPGRPADGSRRRRRSPALGVGGGLLLLAAVGAAVPASYAMYLSWTAAGALDSRLQLLVAYAGGVFGVVAVSALMFAALLVVRGAAGRAA